MGGLKSSKSEVIKVTSRSWLVLNEILSADSSFDHFLEHFEFFNSRIRKRNLSECPQRSFNLHSKLESLMYDPPYSIYFWFDLNHSELIGISVRCCNKYCRNIFDLGRYQLRYWCWILQIESFQSKNWYGLTSSLSNISSECRTEIRSCRTYRTRHSL